MKQTKQILTSKTPASAPATVGCVEVISIPELGIENAWAKVDTGAFSGAVHCTDIRVVRRGLNRKRYLKFTPLGEKRLATETDEFIKIYIRSATGHKVRRFIVDTTIEIHGKTYPVRIGLSDRREMRRPILLGRRFLRENNLLVDVRVNQEYDDEGDQTK